MEANDALKAKSNECLVPHLQRGVPYCLMGT